MRVGLIAPISAGVHFNPGCDQITAGIRWLVRRVRPRAVFVPIEMMSDIPAHWEAAATCDVVILCGNPRFTLSPPSYWECGIWHRLADLEAAGVRVIDGWAGAAHAHAPGLPLVKMVEAIRSHPRNRRYLEIAGTIHRRITRDALMQGIYARAGIGSTLLPCSSWWAAREYGVAGETERDCNAVAVYGLFDHDWAAAVLQLLVKQCSANELPTRVICSTWNDHRWARAFDIKAELIPDAASLTRTFARCKRVAAMRLHAAIPAASVGCEVLAVSIDTRTLACDPFRLPVVPFDQVDTDPLPFRQAKAPDESAVLAVLEEALC